MVQGKKTINKRDLERSRKQILDAAAGEFAEFAMNGARMDRIAQKAFVSKAMIYYVFGGKKDLHLAVLENMFEEKNAINRCLYFSGEQRRAAVAADAQYLF